MKLEFSELIILIIAGIVVLLIGSGFLYWKDKLEILPTFFVAEVAAGYSYLAYYNAREKFRLDLFEKRFESYKNCLKICSIIAHYGDIPDAKKEVEARQNFEKSVNKSIRGLGYHASHFLFGDDIKKLIKEINNMYSTLSSYPDGIVEQLSPEKRQELNEKKTEFAFRAFEITKEMPALFSKYLDMGDYVKK